MAHIRADVPAVGGVRDDRRVIEPGEDRVIPIRGSPTTTARPREGVVDALAGWAAGTTLRTSRRSRPCSGPGCWCRWSRCSARSRSTRRAWPAKTSDMATVLLRGADGRLALLAFTGTGPLRAWNPDGRPVPVATALAARSAIQDGAAALVVDVAGPVRFVVEGDDLVRLAEGWTLARLGERSAWIRPDEESSSSIER